MFQEADEPILGTGNVKEAEAGASGGSLSSPGAEPGKGPRRLMTSFQMDADVARVLALVEEDGRLKSRFINEACRRLGRQRGYALRGRKKAG